MQKLLQISAGVFFYGVRRRAPGLRIKTENKGFAGSRAQTAPVLQREKRKTPASGLRIKTENKGFAGNRAQTAPVLQREKRKISASGLRIKTENKGFAGSQAQTLPARKSRRLSLVSGGSGDGIYASFNFGCPGKLWPGRMFFLWGVKR